MNQINSGDRTRPSMLAKIKSFFGRKSLLNKLHTPNLAVLATHPAPHAIQLEISLEKMDELLAHKQICAADVRCLDPNSKQCLMKLCIQNCLTRSSV
ncbi:MAG: hypothetical protein KAJ63_01530 [Methyloprofundus sp.]|nr:hypothetical protein [Methyloprofundus sp.]